MVKNTRQIKVINMVCGQGHRQHCTKKNTCIKMHLDEFAGQIITITEEEKEQKNMHKSYNLTTKPGRKSTEKKPYGSGVGNSEQIVTHNIMFDVPAASQSSNLDFLLSPESEEIIDSALGFPHSGSCSKKQKNDGKNESRSGPVSKTESWISMEEREEDERRRKEENKKTMNRKYPDMPELKTRPTRKIKPSLKKT